MIEIFISHSSQDAELARDLISLIRDAFNIPPEDIRCTSVDGYRLPGGADTDEQLRTEVSECEMFLGLLSNVSVRSTYVIFELGARWGASKKLIPLLAPGFEPSSLERPISNLNSLRCDSAAQLQQLLTELSIQLALTPNPPASYQRWIDHITSHNSDTFGKSRKSTNKQSTSRMFKTETEKLRTSPEVKILEEIRLKAAEDYPDNFSTQKYFIKQQTKAWQHLKNFSDSQLPDDILQSIVSKAKSDYPNDYSTQLYFVKKQVEAWKALNTS
ncbi:gun4 domain-containing protein [Leptolyngbya sp. Heron Island J]|uniref:toll/interleukin-1 receptor domain-containing protein n=1 Tax=Leptolyngbya sp. Heron Island J TaxID=1385935 RepID=UPI0003B97A90|nr:toll/interleukin-1 receptor domain-containing protein [Leptolyngbya sp. Heron Island J]ESA36963.1 gun4 domain-containing protein [Leptolyngbya sp. Heron Island J]